MEQRFYTIEEIANIIAFNKFQSTVCENEINGLVRDNVKTIQISTVDNDEYFGEFRGNVLEDKYTFIMYLI